MKRIWNISTLNKNYRKFWNNLVCYKNDLKLSGTSKRRYETYEKEQAGEEDEPQYCPCECPDCPCNKPKVQCFPIPKKPKTVRWGIAPVSLIADDFVTSLNVLPDNHHKVMACAASFKTVAEDFANKHDIANVFTSYKQLAKCKDIDVVYVSPLNPWHLEVACQMLEGGKHVLCEKPLCMNEDQAIQLIGLSHMKRRFLMEAMWSRFTPVYQFLRSQIKSEALGEIIKIHVSYGLPLLDVERVARRIYGGGVTMELGTYGIQLAQWIHRRHPIKVEATGKLNEDCVDVCADIKINYGCGRKAEIHISAMEKFENVARIYGTKNCMTIPEYWYPKRIICSDNKEKTFDVYTTDGVKLNYPDRVGLAYQAEEVRKCILEKRNQSEEYNHNEMLIVARVVDQVRKQLGVVYREDRDLYF